MKQSLFLTLVMFGMLAACGPKEQVDTQVPYINTPSLNGKSPGNGLSVQVGAALNLKANLTDNVALSQWQLEVHNDFDAHSHNKTAATPFAHNKVMDISGTSAVVDYSTSLPVTAAAGPYHALFTVLDKAGNAAIPVEFDFEVTSPTQPKVQLTAPAAGTTVARGATLSLSGSVSDESSLASVRLYLASESTGAKLYDQTFTPTAASWDFSELLADPIVIPSTATPGSYHLHIVAKDGEGNYKVAELELTVN